MLRGKKFRRGPANRDPLRKIVGYENGLEILECGHHQVPVQDFVGPTNAVRRRCWRCGRINQEKEREQGKQQTEEAQGLPGIRRPSPKVGPRAEIRSGARGAKAKEDEAE